MATNSANTSTSHTGNGSAGPFSISFAYIEEADVDVFVGGVLKTKTTHYTFTSSTQITFTSGNEPSNGTTILIQRDTAVGAAKVDFQDGSVLTETDLDTNTKQLLHGIQELTDDYVKRDGTQTITANLVFEGATDDGNETTLAITDPTADRTITLPDRSGTVITSGDTGTVTSTMIADGTIVDGDIANTTITGGKLVNDTVTSTQIGANAVTASELADNAVDTNAVQDDAITYSKIQNVSATDRILGRDSSGAGVVEEITPANVRTMINVEDGATADQTNAEIRAAVEAASDSNVFTDADHTKLNGIETSADVTDATNVDAAGAVMNSDLATKGQILVGDGSGDPTALSVGTNNHVLVADSSEATGVKWATVPAGSGMSNLVEDTTPQLGGNLDVQASEINTSTTNGNIKVTPNGTGLFEIKGNTNAGTLQLNCENNSHGVKIKSPAHSAAASYTLTLPTNIVNGQFLKTDTNGVLSWAAVTTDLVGDTSPQLGAELDTNGYDIKLTDGEKLLLHDYGQLKTKTGATNAVVGGLTGYVLQNSTVLDSSSYDLWFQSSGKKITFGTSDSTTHEVMRVQCAAVGASQHGFVNLNYVTANAGGNASSASRLQTTQTGMTFTGVIVPAADSTHDLGTNAVRWRNIYADDLYGSAANLTAIPAANITGTLPAIDGSNLTGITAGAQGGGGESIFFESEIAMDNDYTITSNHNALVAGPLTINATLTINSPSVLTVP